MSSNADPSSSFPHAGGSNEERADLGAVAVRAVVGLPGDIGPAVAQIEDALASIAHLCDRHGLAPAETFKDGLRRYRHDIEGHHVMGGGSPPARRIVDGLSESVVAS